MAVTLSIPNIYATTTNQHDTETNNTTDYNLVNCQKTADNQSTTTSKGVVNTTSNNQNNSQITDSSNTTSKLNQTSENIQYAIAAAGDETFSNVQNNWFTTKDITKASGRVKRYTENHNVLPGYVYIGTTKVTMPQFLELMTTCLIQIQNGQNSQISLDNVDDPTNISNDIQTGDIDKSGYLDLAGRIQSYINTNGRAPNYGSSSSGKVGYSPMVYMYSRILSYYNDYNVLPNYASVQLLNGTTSQASGNSTTSTSNGFTIAQISAAAGTVKEFVEENNRLPNYVEINGKQITMPQFLQLLNTCILQINNKKITSVTLESTDSPLNPTENLNSGNIYKSEYIDLATRIQNYLNSNGRAPNYASSTLGKIQYETLIYLESRILNFYTIYNNLPNYATVNSWSTSNTSSSSSEIPSSYSIYLEATSNCQSTNQNIIDLAKSITAGKTSDYAKASAIFDWVSEHTTYAFYYNTVKGALGTLSSGSANCCDTTHLLIALTRAAGIPARYEHGTCTFSTGTFGHVWAQVYVNGKWYYADAVSERNSFGVINNWDTSNWTLVGIYAELPF